MKTKRLNFVMPLIAIMLAIGGAFAFNTSEMKKDAFVPEIGYIDTERPCTIEVECDTDAELICRDENGIQAFGDDGQKQCSKLLFMHLP